MLALHWIVDLSLEDKRMEHALRGCSLEEYLETSKGTEQALRGCSPVQAKYKLVELVELQKACLERVLYENEVKERRRSSLIAKEVMIE